MDMLQVAAKITTPLSLVAFIAALAFYAYRWRLAERRKTLELASAKDRPRLIESAIRDFTILHTDSLTNDQKYRLIESELKNRMRRFLIAAIVAVIITLAGAITFLVFEKKEPPQAAGAPDQSRSNPTSERAKPAAGGEQQNLSKNMPGSPPPATVSKGEMVPIPAKTQPAPNMDRHFVDSGPSDLVSLRHQDQVKDLSDRDVGKPLSAVPNGVLAYIPPWLIPCASTYEIGVDQVPGGTSILELHKLPNGRTNVVVFVSPKDADNIKMREESLRVSAFSKRWDGEASTPVSIPLSEIVSCQAVSTASHDYRLDLVLVGKSAGP